MKLCEQQTQAEEAVKREGAILTRCSCVQLGPQERQGSRAQGEKQEGWKAAITSQNKTQESWEESQEKIK